MIDVEAPAASQFQLHLGRVAHQAIGRCLTRSRSRTSDPLHEVHMAVADAIAADPLRHDRRRGELLLRSYVRAYISIFLPPPPWDLDGVEVRMAGSRTDLTFVDRLSNRVLVDELKTSSGGRGVVDEDDRAQVARYLPLLRERYGRRLVGIRLVLLAPPSCCYLFSSPADVRVGAPANEWSRS